MTVQNLTQTHLHISSLLGSALVSATYCLKKTASVLRGSEKYDTRKGYWEQASKQKTYSKALAKRVQYFVGTDALSTRFSNTAKAIVWAANTVLLVGLAYATQEHNLIKDQAQLLDKAALSSKAAAGQHIEHCLIANKTEDTVTLLNCLAQVVPELAEAKQQAEDFLNTCRETLTGKENQIISLEDTEKACKAHQANQNTIHSFTIDRLSSSMQKLEKAQSERHSAKHEIDTLKARLAKAKAEQEKVNADNKNLNQTVSEQTSTIASHVAQVANLTQALGLAQNATTEQRGLNQALQTKYNETQGHLEGKQRAMKSNNATIEKLLSDLNSTQTALSKQTLAYKKLQADYSALKNTYSSNDAEISQKETHQKLDTAKSEV